MNKFKFEVIKLQEGLPINSNNRHDYHEFEVVIQKTKDNKYEVFATNERAGIQGVTLTFSTKEEAFDNAVERGRFMKKFVNSSR